MAKKNLIIGGCTNYGINELKPWVLSVNQVMPDADKVMCVGNASSETRNWLVEQGFKIVDMPQANIPVHVLRFLSIYNYLTTTYQDYEYIITTDVKDVYFQQDPFKWLDYHNIGVRDMKQMVAASESIKYKDESWNDQNMYETYGPYVHGLFRNNTVYNVGTLGGSAEYVKDMVFNIFTNGINRPIPIVDQAVYNVLIQTQPFKEITHFAKHSEGWACQAGVCVDPSKIERFRPFLLEKEPIFEDGLVKTSEGKTFCIVHQYDRVPVWKKFVAEKYGQDDPSSLFTYKV